MSITDNIFKNYNQEFKTYFEQNKEKINKIVIIENEIPLKTFITDKKLEHLRSDILYNETHKGCVYYMLTSEYNKITEQIDPKKKEYDFTLTSVPTQVTFEGLSQFATSMNQLKNNENVSNENKRRASNNYTQKKNKLNHTKNIQSIIKTQPDRISSAATKSVASPDSAYSRSDIINYLLDNIEKELTELDFEFSRDELTFIRNYIQELELFFNNYNFENKEKIKIVIPKFLQRMYTMLSSSVVEDRNSIIKIPNIIYLYINYKKQPYKETVLSPLFDAFSDISLKFVNFVENENKRPRG